MKKSLIAALSLSISLMALPNAIGAKEKPLPSNTYYETVNSDVTTEYGTLMKTYKDPNTGFKVEVYKAPEFSISSWESIGSSTWTIKADFTWRTDKTVVSTGGYFGIEVPAHSYEYSIGTNGPYIAVNLYEDDPSDDDFIGKVIIEPSPDRLIYKVYVNGDTDGFPDRAEIYAKYNTNYRTASGSLNIKYLD
ncbi:hypothetical protein Q8G35_18800 [Peribacillus simplex]|uniref:Uncharacterized protein n=2 Tax=Peribacillus TaxID=2675229 RepID=A0AA90P4Z4_9BACI|nr:MULTISPECIES: hypothetical protein [Peribacillus]MDP1420376.1 hypothetical protein [Peribacillus simplex]MDP1453457.1 hypothetical protein [Peribacillus frigoritolerans]